MTRSVLSILALNQPGVLVKVATVISGRGLNIHEVTARVTEQPEFTCIVVDFLGDEDKVKQVQSQLARLEVVKNIQLLEDYNK